MFEAVERCGWKLHAYVIMSNHYHLAVETPEPNLVDVSAAFKKWLIHGVLKVVYSSDILSLIFK